MTTNLMKVGVLAVAILAPGAVLAQSGTRGGAAAGAVGGAVVGGPVGAVVGGTAGAVGGAAVGSLSNDDRTYARHYVVGHREPSFRYENEVRAGSANLDSEYKWIFGLNAA